MNEVTRAPGRVASPLSAMLAWSRTRYEHLAIIFVPFLLCLPLLGPRGLYEFGDANFPLHRFPIQYFLPWQSTSDGGVDNVLIGLPRLAYYGFINVLETISPTLQIAQWLWYSGMLILGAFGALLLARRLGASKFALPLALFWSLNVWSYDRISQGPLFLAYQALPLVLFLLIVFVETGNYRHAVLFALSTTLETPSLQISYLAVFACATLLLYFIFFGLPLRVMLFRVAAVGLMVFAVNAYFLLPLLADVIANNGNSLHLISSNFSDGTFYAYSRNATPLRSMRLSAFFYSTLELQPGWLQVLTFCPIVALILVVTLSPTWRNRSSRFALAGLGIGLWLVSGALMVPNLYFAFRAHVPGLTSFVEPDYFAPVLILGYFLVFALGALFAEKKYGRIWFALLWLTAFLGICTYTPWARPGGSFRQAPIPQEYVRFAHSETASRTLLMPTIWVASYSWAPYTMNGFNASNAPGPYMGPYMLEWISSGSRSVIDSVQAEMRRQNYDNVEALMRILAVRGIAVSVDQLDAQGRANSSDVRDAIASVRAMHGSVSAPVHITLNSSHILTATFRGSLAMAGIYQAPLWIDGENDDVGPVLAALFRNREYRPVIVSASPTSPMRDIVHYASRVDVSGKPRIHKVRFQHDALAAYGAVNKDTVVLTARNFDGVRDCAGNGKTLSPMESRRAIVISGKSALSPCTTAHVTLPLIRPKTLEVFVSEPALNQCACLPTYELRGRHHAPLLISGSPFGAGQMIDVPKWATEIYVTLYGAARTEVKYEPVVIKQVYAHDYVITNKKNADCHEQQLAESPFGLGYLLNVQIGGRCTVVLRQSYSTLWHPITKRNGKALRFLSHELVDGYANGWIVEGNGRFELQLVNVLTLPFFIGVVASVVAILVMIVFCFSPTQNRWLERYASHERKERFESVN